MQRYAGTRVDGAWREERTFIHELHPFVSSNLLPALLVFLLAASPSHAQSRVDSLRGRLDDTGGLQRVGVLIELMRELNNLDPSQARAYGREALSLLYRHPEPELRADVLYFISGTFYYQDERDSALVYAEQSRDLAERVIAARLQERSIAANIQERHGQAERFIGHIYHDWGRYAEAEVAYRRAFEVFERIDHRRRMADAVNDLAILYKTQGKFQEAMAHHEQALLVYEELGLEHDAANVLHGLGIVYSHMGRYDEALDTFFRVLEVRQRLGDREDLAGTLTNIGGTFEYLEDYAQALAYYRRARAIYESLGRKNRLAIALTNLGSAHYYLEQYDEARSSYEQARALAGEVRNERLTAYVHEGLGRLYEKQGALPQARAAFEAALAGFETLGDRRGIATSLMAVGRMRGGSEGIAAIRRAVELARVMDSHLLLRDGYAQLADLYAGQGRYAEALDAYKQYKAAYDSLFNVESQATIAELETQYRTKEQQQQIALLEQKRQVQRLWLFGLLSGIGLLGVITALSLNRVRLRQRALTAQEKAHRAEAERARLLTEAAEAKVNYLQTENERKAQELEAARRLQLSMLPKSLPTHPNAALATLMRTATEVGGDYYDFEVGPDGALTMALGDATGHGMQAGTLVAAVKSLFSSYSGEPDLAQALYHSARALRRMALPNLYMAFALARLRGYDLELAGAGMPPALIYRAASGTVEAVSLKGMPLGAPAEFPYEKQRVTLLPGDTVVLMSDGFPELRDGSGKQFGYDRVAEVVREVGSRDPQRITRHFEEAIRTWGGDKPIDDDITFLILKIRDDSKVPPM